MPIELAKQYDPREAQERWLKFWNERGFFHSDPPANAGGSPQANAGGSPEPGPFTIVIPPPNVTGALHMGHALNNTLQDVLIRFKRMQGFNALWMPGTDHAGIATQAVVERLIYQQEKKTRRELGREELVRRIWQWKDQYEARILGQLKQLGCSCDWRRTRFTLDEVCSRAVRQTFFDFFKKGLIFRGKRLVNWDTQLQTSVADDETFHETVKGNFWTFKYPVRSDPLQRVEPPESGHYEQECIRFSTTRPETMLGDTAVAVHPNDERYRHLIGKMVTIPLLNRDIPIIADGLLVDPALGTGAVKVTPAHDPNDYQCGLRHKLPMINILNPDGTINANGGKYAGLDRFEARKRVTADMEALGLLEKVEEREIDLAHSDRSKTPIEPYLSDQWFVRMGDGEPGVSTPGLAQMAMDAVTSGRVKFFPERYAKTYLDWLGEKRDWCISRQLWWGHRIPVWRLEKTGFKLTKDEAKLPAWEGYDLALSRFVREELPKLLEPLRNFLAATGTENETAIREQIEQHTLRVYICSLTERADGVLRDLTSFFSSPQQQQVSSLSVKHPAAVGFAIQAQAAFPHPIVEESDVLDTWFSSQLWPFATLGWPEETAELKYYYPTNVLVTSRGIITLWVARMVLAGLFEMKEVPFPHVYITPTILDGFGETMSKSKGNGVDPLDIIERYGTDALRFHMAYVATETQDSRMPVVNVCPHCDTFVPMKQEHLSMRTRKVTCPSCKKPFRPGGPWPAEDPELPTAKQASEVFETGRNFANKLWNAARFLLMNLEGYTPGGIRRDWLPIEDKWILSRLVTTALEVTEQLEAYRFSEAARTLYDFTWSDFCDWYVEMSKSRLRDDAERPSAQRVLIGVLDTILRLIHPIMPFVTESIWQALNEAAFERGLPNPEPARESVMIAPWPELPLTWVDGAIEHVMARMQELVRSIRNIRNEYNVDERATVEVFVRCDALVAEHFDLLRPFILHLAKASKLECGPGVTRPPQSAAAVHPEFEAYVALAGLIDVPTEIKRQEKLKAEKERQLAGVRAKLSNRSFVEKAPAEVVAQQRAQEAELASQIQAIEANLAQLRTG